MEGKPLRRPESFRKDNNSPAWTYRAQKVPSAEPYCFAEAKIAAGITLWRKAFSPPSSWSTIWMTIEKPREALGNKAASDT
jgi:hypothetical protein